MTSAGIRRGLVAAVGTLALAATAAGCGSGSTSSASGSSASAASVASGAVTVDITNFSFHPSPLSIAKGTTVMWKNGDGSTHTSTGDHKEWDTGNIDPGSAGSFTFASAGTFTYHCAIHTYMTATITVTG